LVQDVAGCDIDAALIRTTVDGIAEGREGVQSFLGKRAPAWLPSR
jgi:methylglutaconyl-CoA hydratase